MLLVSSDKWIYIDDINGPVPQLSPAPALNEKKSGCFVNGVRESKPQILQRDCDRWPKLFLQGMLSDHE